FNGAPEQLRLRMTRFARLLRLRTRGSTSMSIGKAVIFYVSLSSALLTPIAAQTTNFTGTLTTSNTTPFEVLNRGFQGTGAIGALGNGVVSLNLAQQLSENDYVSGIGPVTPV